MGRLIYVIGPSGAGKDSVLTAARAQAPADLWFAHRYITRPAGDASENHVALTESEFETRRAAGGFALDWRANGLRYGIGAELDAWLARGVRVVVNGSRAALPHAAARYPSLLPVLITADAETLRARLLARGRETPETIAARLARLADAEIAHPALVTVVNDGGLDAAVRNFLAAIR